MFSNKYDELSTDFAISSPNQNEYFKIYLNKLYNNNNNSTEELAEMFYKYSDNMNDINNLFFTIEFQNRELKNIISTLHESIKYYNPQIYSSQMFYIINFNKTLLYKVKNNYTLIYKYIYGTLTRSAWVDVSFKL